MLSEYLKVSMKDIDFFLGVFLYEKENDLILVTNYSRYRASLSRLHIAVQDSLKIYLTVSFETVFTCRVYMYENVNIIIKVSSSSTQFNVKHALLSRYDRRPWRLSLHIVNRWLSANYSNKIKSGYLLIHFDSFEVPLCL